MPDTSRLTQLTDIFRMLKADHPEDWALSEIEEDIPQLARFLFLRMAWDCIIMEHDAAWIDATIHDAERYPTAPGAGAGLALQRVLAQGVSRQDIVDIVRVKQYEALFALCYRLDEPDIDMAEIGATGWALTELNYDGQHTGRLVQGLYESLLSMDPTGREMRPRTESTNES